MKGKFILLALIGLGVIVISAFTAVKPTGEEWRSNSPWDGSTCSTCHSGGATIPTLSITASPAFGTGNTYTANTTYTITATVAGSYTAYGFNLEIITTNATAGAKDAGIYGTILSPNTQIYAHTTNPSTMSHSAPANGVFSFVWTAPDTGKAYVYFAGLGVNDDGTDTGDKVSTTSMTLTPASSAGIATYQNNDINLTVFPNPTTDNVHITYTVKEAGTIAVKLYNLNGDFVADLLNETQDIGLQSSTAVLPTELAKGLYMIKLTINGKQTTQKLMVY
jgi:type IX secretion system substrate protein